MDSISPENRLRRRIVRLQRKSTRMPPCALRNELVSQLERDEIALALLRWLKSPCNRRPPGDLIPIRLHRLT